MNWAADLVYGRLLQEVNVVHHPDKMLVDFAGIHRMDKFALGVPEWKMTCWNSHPNGLRFQVMPGVPRWFFADDRDPAVSRDVPLHGQN